jgi:signal transduction histidine kinase
VNAGRRRAIAVSFLVVPAAALVFGWSYASFREVRLKEIWIADREAQGEDMSSERAYTRGHALVEVASVVGLSLLLVAGGVTTARAAARARELSEKKTAFVAAVTHELRTPLTTLRMHAEMLRDGLVTEERRARVHDELAREAERLSRLVENVLALSKLEEGRWAPALEERDLGREVGVVLDELAPRVAESGFVLHRELDEGVRASFDPRALELIVQNLVDNALKHGRSPDRCELTVKVRADADGAIVDVEDRGPGIAEAERAVVFDRFRRSANVAARTPGVGVGLALVRELARAQGGDARALPCALGARLEVRLRSAALTKA